MVGNDALHGRSYGVAFGLGQRHEQQQEDVLSRLRMLPVLAIAAFTLVVLGPSFLEARSASADEPFGHETHETGSFQGFRGSGFHRDILGSLYQSTLLQAVTPIPGQYCSDKTGGDIFVPTGVQPDPGLTCPAVLPSAAASATATATGTVAPAASPTATAHP